jgi:bifunctional ADP-heptose synthase (sugar kinase/adenylyltransferase)
VGAARELVPEQALPFLRTFRQRHAPHAVIAALQGLRPLRALLIGDAIIDEYHYVQSMGKSPKELLVSTRYLREEHFPGGILACANHLAGFCDHVDLVTVLGARDSREAFVRDHLRANIRPRFWSRPDTGTIVKRRFVEETFLSKMFQVAYLDDREIAPSISEVIAAELTGELERYDLVVVADYGHGFLTKDLILLLAMESPFLAVNVQTNSANAGYNLVTKYPRADYVCIDEPEARLALHDRAKPIPDLIRHIAKELSARRVSITRGHQGAVTYEEDHEPIEVPVLSSQVVDRIGAGDAYLAVTAPAAASGVPPELLGFIGNAVGALAVRIVGNRAPVDPEALFTFVTAILES